MGAEGSTLQGLEQTEESVSHVDANDELRHVVGLLRRAQAQVRALTADNEQLAAANEEFAAEYEQISAENDQLRMQLKDCYAALSGSSADAASGGTVTAAPEGPAVTDVIRAQEARFEELAQRARSLRGNSSAATSDDDDDGDRETNPAESRRRAIQADLLASDKRLADLEKSVAHADSDSASVDAFKADAAQAFLQLTPEQRLEQARQAMRDLGITTMRGGSSRLRSRPHHRRGHHKAMLTD